MESNETLVQYLRLRGWLRSPQAIAAFSEVDRALFVPTLLHQAAYLDQPLQVGPIHISAPFVYALALEHLELVPGLRFLNIGSGTGYFSSLAHRIVGNSGTNHGVEINPKVLKHAKQSIQQFRERLHIDETIQIILALGNGLVFCPNEPYDRIYIGAGCKLNKTFMDAVFPLLSCPGGILVAPLNGQLRQIVRLSHSEFQVRDLARVHFASIRPVKACDRLNPPRLPARAWSPEVHHTFPPSFKRLVLMILAVAKRQDCLPVGIWCEILSYLHCSDLSDHFRQMEFKSNVESNGEIEDDSCMGVICPLS